MSFFSKMFGSKDSADKSAAEPLGGDFITALAAHLRGDLEPALLAYLKLAEEVPGSTSPQFFAAAISAAKGDTKGAVESLRFLSHQASLSGDSMSRAIALELAPQVNDSQVSIPAVAEVIVSFGELLKKERFVQESVVCFEIAASLVPDNANVLHKLGDTLHDLRIYDYAESVLQEALRCAPYHWGALYTYAVLLQDLGRDEEAIDYYKQAVRLNPNHAHCQNNYGAALLRTNRPEEALAHCNQAARLAPNSPLVKINLGNIHMLLKQYETARSCFTEAIALNAKVAPAYFGLASVERALNSDPKRVQELYLKALEVNPAIPEVHQALGNLLAEQADPQALEHFSAAAQLNSNMRNLHRDFGNACLRLGRREEALDHFKTALLQNPDDLAVQEVVARMEAEARS